MLLFTFRAYDRLIPKLYVMERKKAPHILNTSATLFGFCYLVLTTIKVLRMNAETFIDEFTTAAMFIFMVSCLFSFLSIRSVKRGESYERIADYSFLTGLLCLFGITLFIFFNHI